MFRCAASLLVFASSVSLAAAGDAGAGPEAPQTDIRKELLSEYKYVKETKDPAAKAPTPSTTGAAQQAAPPAPGDSAPLVMDAFTVHESTQMDRLHEDVLNQDADARRAEVTSKLGVGMHVAPMGPLGFYAVTVFYIPIAVGVGFAF